MILLGNVAVLVRLDDGTYGLMEYSGFRIEEELAKEIAEAEKNRPAILPAFPPKRSLRASVNASTPPEAVAKLLWELILSKCHTKDGDIYFHYANLFGHTQPSPVFTLTEYRNATFTFHAAELSDAERLNGLQWFGYTQISSSAARTLLPPQAGGGGRWSHFKDDQSLTIDFMKLKGAWYFKQDVFDLFIGEARFGDDGKPESYDYDPDETASHRLACSVATAEPTPYAARDRN